MIKNTFFANNILDLYFHNLLHTAKKQSPIMLAWQKTLLPFFTALLVFAKAIIQKPLQKGIISSHTNM